MSLLNTEKKLKLSSCSTWLANKLATIIYAELAGAFVYWIDIEVRALKLSDGKRQLR